MSKRYRAIYYKGLLAEYEDGVLIGSTGAEISNNIASGPQVIRDIEPYKSMINGEMITSRSRHRDHLRAHGCIEVGNEVKAAMKRPEISVKDTRKQMLHSLVGDKSDRQVQQMVKAEIARRHG